MKSQILTIVDKKYNISQFYADRKRLIEIAKNRIAYYSSDMTTFRVTFSDKVLGLCVDVYLSTKTVMLRKKSSNNLCILRKQSWRKISSIFNNLYNYV